VRAGTARKRALGCVIHNRLLVAVVLMPSTLFRVSTQRKPSGEIDFGDRCDKLF
jgi:hypothetical protein